MSLTPQQSLAQNNLSQGNALENVDINVFGSARLRYQSLDQDNLTNNAEALTLGVKAGLEFEHSRNFSALIEFEASEQLIDDFNDTLNGRVDRPVIIDVTSAELNRFQLQTEVIPNTRLTLGRQNFALDNWRFLGDWGFRQNDQTYDALRVETSLGKARVNLGYFNKVHRHFSNDSPIGEFSGDSLVLNLSHPAPIGQLSLFHYALDLETGLPQQLINSLSNQTTGIRWQGRRHWDQIGIVWDSSYARQSDYANNPNDYSTNYVDLDIGLQLGCFEVSTGLETLGSDNGVALQTPLGSLHSFQGVTDRFFSTPSEGLRDYHSSIKFDWGDIGPFERVKTEFGFHDFNDADNNRDYGRELNLRLSGKIKNINLLLEFGDYNSSALPTDRGLFASDAQTFLLSTQYSFD